MITELVMVYITMQMEINMRENGRMIVSMVEAFTFFLMVNVMKVIYAMARNVVEVYIIT